MDKTISVSQKTKQVINDFLALEGERETKEKVSAFLFELQGLYFSQPDLIYIDEDPAGTANRFRLLYNLINGIEAIA